MTATTIGNYYTIGLQITTQQSPTFATTRWSPTRMTVKALQPSIRLSNVQIPCGRKFQAFSYTTIFHGFKIQVPSTTFSMYMEQCYAQLKNSRRLGYQWRTWDAWLSSPWSAEMSRTFWSCLTLTICMSMYHTDLSITILIVIIFLWHIDPLFSCWRCYSLILFINLINRDLRLYIVTRETSDKTIEYAAGFCDVGW